MLAAVGRSFDKAEPIVPHTPWFSFSPPATCPMQSSKLLALAGVSAALLGVTAPASAQQQTEIAGVNANNLDPAPAGDSAFGVQSPDARGEALFRAMVLFDYVNDPVVLYNSETDEQIGAVVSDQFWLHLSPSFALADRVLFSLDLPIALIQSGDDACQLPGEENCLPPIGGRQVVAADGTDLGDLRLGARVRLFGEPDRGFQLGAGLHFWLPTAPDNTYAGDEGVRGKPFFVLGGREDALAWSVELGALFRPGKRMLGDAPVGTAITFGAGVFFLVDEARTVQIGPELYGLTTVSDGGSAFAADSTSVEALFSVRWRINGGDFVIGAGAGPGFGRAIGAPDFRVVGMVGYLPETDSSRKDRDGDDVPDDKDACPDDAGVKTPDPATNGCPAPPGDQDADGVKDEVDKCPTQWGEKDNQGCPKDRDKDGIGDYEDACPDEPGQHYDDPKNNGCPRARVVEEENAIIISERIEFDHGKATIKPESDDLLDDVAKVLKENPEIEEVEIQGHTDNTGSADVNRRLSNERANSVRKALIDRGIEKKRLRAKGYGPDKPIADNDSDSGRTKNRRVEFKITKGPGAGEK